PRERLREGAARVGGQHWTIRAAADRLQRHRRVAVDRLDERRMTEEEILSTERGRRQGRVERCETRGVRGRCGFVNARVDLGEERTSDESAHAIERTAELGITPDVVSAERVREL